MLERSAYAIFESLQWAFQNADLSTRDKDFCQNLCAWYRVNENFTEKQKRAALSLLDRIRL